MGAIAVARLRWATRFILVRLSRRIGWQGIWLAAWLVALAGARAIDQDLQKELRREQIADTQRHLHPRIAVGSKPLTIDEELQLFQARLPSSDEAMRILDRLLSLAERHNLSLSHGDYKSQFDAIGGFVRFQMSLPVSGDSREIQHFIQEAMISNPLLAVDSVSFKREGVESLNVEAKIQMTLFTSTSAEQSAGVQSAPTP